jgi:hypothetical protein
MPSLYELTQDYKVLLNADADDVDEWNAAIDALTGDIEMKVTNIGFVILEYNAEEVKLTDEIKRLTARRDAVRNRRERLKTYAQEAMETAGIDRNKDVRVTVRIQNNPPRLVLSETFVPPDEFLVPQEPKLDASALKDAVKNGRYILGASVVQERSLRVK